MPRYLVKLDDDAYVEWSTVVDAPVTHVVTRAETIRWNQRQGCTLPEAQERTARTDKNGHSAMWFSPESTEQLIAGNRAGEGESELSLAEILEQYARVKEAQ